MSDELLARLARINAALDATVERDLTEFRATETVDERGFRLSQDFLRDSTPAQLANDAASVFDNIAKIKNHMIGWCNRNGHDRARIDALIKRCVDLQICLDLADLDKHGGRPVKHTGLKLTLSAITRALRLIPSAERGTPLAAKLSAKGTQIMGDGVADVIMVADITDTDGNKIGDLRKTCMGALDCIEEELRDWGFSLPQRPAQPSRAMYIGWFEINAPGVKEP